MVRRFLIVAFFATAHLIATSVWAAPEDEVTTALPTTTPATTSSTGEVESVGAVPLQSVAPTFSSRSEFFHQDAGNTTHVELSPTYQTGTETFSQINGQGQQVSGEHDTTSAGFSVIASHGWNSILKSSMNLRFSESDSIRSSSTSAGRNSYHYSGVNDLQFGTQAMLPVGRASLFLGANAWISPTSHQRATTSLNGNEFSGGQSVMPYVGLEAAISRWRVGSQLGYRYMGPRTDEAHSSRSAVSFQATETGGHLLQVIGFSEYHLKQTIVGLAITGDIFSSATENEPPRANSPGAINYSGYSQAKVTAYGVWNLDKIEVLPAVSYTTLLTPNRDGLSDSASSDLSVSLSGRIAL